MASRTAESPARSRRRSWVLAALGGYYILFGAWPLFHFDSFAALVALPIHPFQAHTLGAVTVVLGACFIEAARREWPGPFPTLVGIATASAIAFTELVWLPQLRLLSALWIDLTVQLAAVVALLLLYPRNQQYGGRARARRR